MKYHYVGVSRSREEVHGIIDAEDENELELKLRAMQIRPISISESEEESSSFFSLEKLKNISIGKITDLKTMMIFTRQFSALIDAGIPVVQCIDILASQQKKFLFRKTLEKIKSDIEGGLGLAESFSKYPKAFNEFFIRIIEAGEISGTLDIALKRISAQIEKLSKLKSKVIGALMYPILTIFVAIGVFIFLLVKVVPTIAQMYSQSNASLPEITLWILSISNWLQLNWYLLIVLLFLIIVGFSILYRIPMFRLFWDPFILRFPIIGSLILRSEVAKFTRTMGTLVTSGVPLLNTFSIVEKVVNNLSIKKALKLTADFVSEGKDIASGLSYDGIFPPMVVHMVKTGEMTGKLDEMLLKVAEIYDDEVDDAVKNVTTLLQPILIVIIGVLVALILIAMYLPIFQLADKLMS